jgi:solute carrier family 25 protein 39/40
MADSNSCSFISLCGSSPSVPKNVQRQLMASSAGGIISTLLLSPIGVVKTRIQSTGLTSRQAMVAVYASAGLRGYWAGVGAGLAQTIPSTAVYMATYEAISKDLKQVPELATIYPAIAGATARTLAVTLIAPIELIRTKQMGGIRGSFLSIYRNIVRDHGYKGLFRGWTSTVMRDSPFSAIYWLCFESFRPKYRGLLTSSNSESKNDTSNNRNSSRATPIPILPALPPHPSVWQRLGEPLATFLSGASSGVVAAIFTHPFDLLKTRQQILRPEEKLGPPLPEFLTSATEEGRVLLREQACKEAGALARASCRLKYVACWWRHFTVRQQCTTHNFQGLAQYIDQMLFRGLPLRLAMIIPGGGIMITVYETVKSWNDPDC